jgi:hypothetical protein
VRGSGVLTLSIAQRPLADAWIGATRLHGQPHRSDQPSKLSRRRLSASPIGALKQGLVVVSEPWTGTSHSPSEKTWRASARCEERAGMAIQGWRLCTRGQQVKDDGNE